MLIVALFTTVMSCWSSQDSQCQSLSPKQCNHEKCLNNRMLCPERVKNHIYSLQVFCAWNRDKSKTTHMVLWVFQCPQTLAWPQRETSNRATCWQYSLIHGGRADPEGTEGRSREYIKFIPDQLSFCSSFPPPSIALLFPRSSSPREVSKKTEFEVYILKSNKVGRELVLEIKTLSVVLDFTTII